LIEFFRVWIRHNGEVGCVDVGWLIRREKELKRGESDGGGTIMNPFVGRKEGRNDPSIIHSHDMVP